MRCLFCCAVVEIYGQTESCGASFATKTYDTISGHVGAPGLGVEYKLFDLPEMNYTKDTKPYPSGEICIRGPAIFLGYFKNKRLTDETLDKAIEYYLDENVDEDEYKEEIDSDFED